MLHDREGDHEDHEENSVMLKMDMGERWRRDGETQDHCWLHPSMAYWIGTCSHHLNRAGEIQDTNRI